MATSVGERMKVSALGYSDNEIERMLGPYVTRRMPMTSPEWRSLVAREAAQRKVALRYWRKRLLGWSWSRQSRQKLVEATYGHIWSEPSLTPICNPTAEQMPHQWRDEGLVINSAVIQKIHLGLMTKAVRSVSPTSVLEVGSGWGVNLLVLSCQCPETRFHGIEVTREGVERNNALVEANVLPQTVLRFMPESAPDPAGYRRVTVEQGSAERLPYPDNSFDLVMTRLALEQMESIREAALSEIARVARSHVLLVESFREMNDEGIRRQYMVGSDYFRGRIADLPLYGLDPIFTFADWPHKITMKPVLVLAKKAGAISAARQ
jgi:hypothetical protein